MLTARDDGILKVTRAPSRQARMFSTATSVEFSDNPADTNTVMELVTADRPGLLSKVGQIFLDQEIDITSAKIVTIGEKAEDVFLISHVDGSPLADEDKDRLCTTLKEVLGSSDG